MSELEVFCMAYEWEDYRLELSFLFLVREKVKPTRNLVQYFLTSWKQVPDNSPNQVEPNWNLENIIPWTCDKNKNNHLKPNLIMF